MAGELAQRGEVMERHHAIAEGEQLALAQLAQDPVDMDRGQPTASASRYWLSGQAKLVAEPRPAHCSRRPS